MSSIPLMIIKKDVDLFYILNRKINCRPLDILMKGITELGSTASAVILSVFLLGYDLVYPGKTWTILLFNLILGQAIIQGLKRLINRPRPYKTFEWALPIKPPSCIYSFPSGHSVTAFSLAMVFSCVFPHFTLLFFAAASLVGFSRIYLGCHYPTDVLTGILVAFFVFRMGMILL